MQLVVTYHVMKIYYKFIYTSLILASFSYGIFVGKYEVFPYQLIRAAKDVVMPTKESSVPNWRSANSHKLFLHFSTKSDVAFVGDSLINSGRWSEYFPDFKVVNRGVRGDKASDIVNRIGSVLSAHPTKAFIMVGINDVSSNVPVPKILDTYSAIVDILLEANVEVFIQSTIQCEISLCGAKLVNSVAELNKGLNQLALAKSVKFVDLDELSKNSGLKPLYTVDGYHLSAEGYIYWVDKLQPYVSL